MESSGLLPAGDVCHVVVPVGALAEGVSSVELPDDAHHHLAHVLRLRPGQRITLTDGNGRWGYGVLGAGFLHGASVEVTAEVRVVPEPPDVGVAFALTKGDKPETVVQKLTELGLRRIVLVRAERSVVRWESEKAERNRQRLETVSRNALEQCRGVWLPIIEPMVGVGALVGRPGVVRADRGGRRLQSTDQLVVVGPEGGWTDSERDLLSEAIGLPGSVLRAETAAIVAGAMLMHCHAGAL